jgi:tetraacyldisaccharide 4'-kinase
MRAPEFWWRNTLPARLAAVTLAPLGIAYGASVFWKHRTRKPYRARVPVICVGNLTVGGTGKTPVAIAIARLLQERGLSPVFLLRGYGRKPADVLVVQSERHEASNVGDEALLLARVAPTVVSSDRGKSARLAEQDTQVIIMDDGHQNFSLHKDLSLVVVDSETGFGNGRVVPAGPLREPVRHGLRRADAVVVMGDGDPPLPDYVGPVLRAGLSATTCLGDCRVLAFAGIGRPEKFFTTLRKAGVELMETRAYADHHQYSAAEIAGLKARAVECNAMLITTEKDFVRLPPGERDGIAVLPVRAVFEDEPAVMRLLEPLLSTASTAR